LHTQLAQAFFKFFDHFLNIRADTRIGNKRGKSSEVVNFGAQCFCRLVDHL